MTVKEVMADIVREIPFYDESRGGVTFSGGEPLMQPTFLSALLKACRAQEIHTVVDTSGFANWKVFEQIREDVDLFLYDLKHMNSFRHREVTGVPNEVILENCSLKRTGRHLHCADLVESPESTMMRKICSKAESSSPACRTSKVWS